MQSCLAAVEASPLGDGVIPICASAFPDIKPYAYWVDECFVVPSQVTQELSCSHAFHNTQCDDISAVRQYRTGRGLFS